jgi:hypothetical protein
MPGFKMNTMMWSLILGFLGSLTMAAPAADPHNTYQFNRRNHFLQNGLVEQKPWFEWWYFKVTPAHSLKSFYFVYGTVNPWDLNGKNPASRSYVGMGDFQNNLIIEERFPVAAFAASYEKTAFKIGAANTASDSHLQGQITNANHQQASWNIAISKRWTYNAEGWATGRNITAIEWYPAQADARCTGEVTVNGETEHFVDAPCYQDRNWGSQFPEWWAWIVSNDFKNSPGTALAIGGGQPHMFDVYKKYEGLSVGFRHQGKEYNWRPNEAAIVKFNIKFGQWKVSASNAHHRLDVSAYAPRDRFMDLEFMTPQGRVFHDYEALRGNVKVKLYERSHQGLKWKLLADLDSDVAGLEFGSYSKLEEYQ